MTVDNCRQWVGQREEEQQLRFPHQRVYTDQGLLTKKCSGNCTVFHSWVGGYFHVFFCRTKTEPSRAQKAKTTMTGKIRKLWCNSGKETGSTWGKQKTVCDRRGSGQRWVFALEREWKWCHFSDIVSLNAVQIPLSKHVTGCHWVPHSAWHGGRPELHRVGRGEHKGRWEKGRQQRR